MKRLLLVLAFLLVFALPSSASAFNANRIISTTCYVNPSTGVNSIWTYLQSSGASRYTTVPCTGWVPDPSKPWYVVGRPGTDLEGAIRSARAWFPACEPSNYAQSGPEVSGGKTYYHWWFHVCTS